MTSMNIKNSFPFYTEKATMEQNIFFTVDDMWGNL